MHIFAESDEKFKFSISTLMLTICFSVGSDDVGAFDEKTIHRHFERVDIHIIIQTITQITTSGSLFPVISIEYCVLIVVVAAFS